MLILVPSPLSQTTPRLPILSEDLPLVQQCVTWLVENPKPARAALKLLNMPVPIRDLKLYPIAETKGKKLDGLLADASNETPLALMSDAGCPGIADPGAEVVGRAHQMGCQVLPLIGPSSITLGLMASGLNGQNFHFWGYPPLQDAERTAWIKTREQESKRSNTTQIVIETPFRNQKLFDALTQALSPTTLLCVASDLSGRDQTIKTLTVEQWRRRPAQLKKQPALFLWLTH